MILSLKLWQEWAVVIVIWQLLAWCYNVVHFIFCELVQKRGHSVPQTMWFCKRCNCNTIVYALELRVALKQGCIYVHIINSSPPSAAYMRQWIGSDNGLSPIRREAIILTNAVLLSIRPLRTNFSEILIKIQNLSFTKMHQKILSAKWRPFCHFVRGEMNLKPNDCQFADNLSKCISLNQCV